MNLLREGFFIVQLQKHPFLPTFWAKKHILVDIKKPVQISIPSPCHENWTAMTPAEKGRFCGSCQRVVHDFTRSSDREIAEALSKDSNACGRFLNTQLERELIVIKEKSTAWIAASAAVVSVLAVGTDAVAQTPVPTEQQPQHTDEHLEKVAISETGNLITGAVKDSAGLAIPGVSVIVRGTSISTQTDFDGKYSIEAKPGVIIEYSYVGMGTIITKVRDAKSICVTMHEDFKSITVGIILTVKNRTFFGRIFRSIGNWFTKDDAPVRYKVI